MNRILNFFKKKNNNFNVYHPDFSDKVEKAFVADGVQYWAFKKDTTMPYGRYKYMITFVKQVDLRMTGEILAKYIEKIEQHISGERGTVNLVKVAQVLEAIKSRLALTFELETTYDYASVVYFDDTENLYSYDVEYNKKKKNRWREANTLDFFYTKPMSELFGLSDISKTDLENFLAVQPEIISDPTLETQEQ